MLGHYVGAHGGVRGQESRGACGIQPRHQTPRGEGLQFLREGRASDAKQAGGKSLENIGFFQVGKLF